MLLFYFKFEYVLNNTMLALKIRLKFFFEKKSRIYLLYRPEAIASAVIALYAFTYRTRAIK